MFQVATHEEISYIRASGWTPVYSWAPGNELLGWSDPERPDVVMRADEAYRLQKSREKEGV